MNHPAAGPTPTIETPPPGGPETLMCPGLPAEWINGWLAAVGTTVLDPRVTLSWTDDPSPVAVLHHPTQPPAEAIAAAWPDTARIEGMPVAPLARKATAAAVSERIRARAGHPDAWTLTSTLTDLEPGDTGEAGHGMFDPAAPGTTGALHQRLAKVNRHARDHPAGIGCIIAATFQGTSAPVNDNGLGFDISRLPDRAAAKRATMVHPAVEVLAFFGLALLPVRADGRRTEQPHTRQRGRGVGEHRGFLWPAWTQPLDRWAIDALLDAWHRTWRSHRGPHVSQWRRLGVHAAWETRPYDSPNSSDHTRGFSSQPVMPDVGRVARQQPPSGSTDPSSSVTPG